MITPIDCFTTLMPAPMPPSITDAVYASDFSPLTPPRHFEFSAATA